MAAIIAGSAVRAAQVGDVVEFGTLSENRVAVAPYTITNVAVGYLDSGVWLVEGYIGYGIKGNVGVLVPFGDTTLSGIHGGISWQAPLGPVFLPAFAMIGTTMIRSRPMSISGNHVAVYLNVYFIPLDINGNYQAPQYMQGWGRVLATKIRD